MAHRQGRAILVRGIVQGVGFRPFVAGLAHALGLDGEVVNTAQGVEIRIWGDRARLDAFTRKLTDEAPPLARIDALQVVPLEGDMDVHGFRICESEMGMLDTGIPADAATCEQCLQEVFDPDDRRFAYAFTNCTNCGPRFSIIRRMPYDRCHTSMASFDMCPACHQEYTDARHRRFHAQPNACPVCGPGLIWLDASGTIVEVDDHIRAAAKAIRAGLVVAIKGIGGIHLACDATNEDAVARLRERKRRWMKPFALMAGDLAQVKQYAVVSALEANALQSPAAPVVLVRKRKDINLSPMVAPGQDTLGFMLPYSPLHHLLMRRLEHPIVLTSGNRSDEPQCIDNADALKRLSGIADAFLLHDRPIVNRLDDSVVRVMDGAPRILRRARGFVPEGFPVPAAGRSSHGILAMGAELKNTFCLSVRGHVVVSQHMGDLHDARVNAAYRKTLEQYRELFDFAPDAIAVDMHPGYFSTHWGRRLAEAWQLPLIEVQHHHAHIAAVMLEHHLPWDARVLGVAMDGLGMGADGSLWGGEFLLAGYPSFQRLGKIAPAVLVGGERAMREPWRNTWAQLRMLGWESVQARYGALPFMQFMQDKPVQNLEVIASKGINAPLASSMGRLFDAVAALLGICRFEQQYEGQAAMELERLAVRAAGDALHQIPPYPLEIERKSGLLTLDWKPMWWAILADLQSGMSHAWIAARFHATVVHGIVAVVQQMASQHAVTDVVLSGGVFQNRLLLEATAHALRRHDLRVLLAKHFPCNDGGISLGQAAVGLTRMAENQSCMLGAEQERR